MNRLGHFGRLDDSIFAEFQVDDVYRRMRRDGWPVGAIHGDKTQPERDQVLNGETCFISLLALSEPLSLD